MKRAAWAQEPQRKCNTQLDECQDIGGQWAVKEFATLQEVQEGRKMVDGKAGEEHPLKKDMINYRETVERVQL